ncbi:23S rRNA (adenine(2030)-N(6))-methyltransferase RlmJ [Rhodobacteraceae bacterium XHP0102]|nr:23S rRNA (adenine(2030)-N(6))-methyltransferase RlmJ [Rhodobacteraceae bacterium XHP0102]
MLSYQHIYHAGNLADVHKHAALAWVLDYLTGKDKPLSYIETHAGRGLYDLRAAEAIKTGEAKAGIGRLAQAFAPDHPYRRVLTAVAQKYGPNAYAGSPLVAAELLRAMDNIHLAELHPQEHSALKATMQNAGGAQIYQQDGFEMAQSICPPEPRRGVMLIDPSYEIKTDYDRIPKIIGQLARKWNVGIVILWYPILTNQAQQSMVKALRTTFPEAIIDTQTFPPAREGHGMVGSGLFILNPPFGMQSALEDISRVFAQIKTA